MFQNTGSPLTRQFLYGWISNSSLVLYFRMRQCLFVCFFVCYRVCSWEAEVFQPYFYSVIWYVEMLPIVHVASRNRNWPRMNFTYQCLVIQKISYYWLYLKAILLSLYVFKRKPSKVVSQLWIKLPNIENCLIRRPLYTVLVCGFDKKCLIEQR